MFEQLLCHLWGDYIFQSDWMAQNKTKNSRAAFVHALFYTVPFFFFATMRWHPLAVILISHFLIDRFALARFVVAEKNRVLRPVEDTTNYNTSTGYPASCPLWLAVWLLIICDNTLHLTINYLALRFL